MAPERAHGQRNHGTGQHVVWADAGYNVQETTVNTRHVSKYLWTKARKELFKQNIKNKQGENYSELACIKIKGSRDPPAGMTGSEGKATAYWTGASLQKQPPRTPEALPAQPQAPNGPQVQSGGAGFPRLRGECSVLGEHPGTHWAATHVWSTWERTGGRGGKGLAWRSRGDSTSSTESAVPRKHPTVIPPHQGQVLEGMKVSRPYGSLWRNTSNTREKASCSGANTNRGEVADPGSKAQVKAESISDTTQGSMLGTPTANLPAGDPQLLGREQQRETGRKDRPLPPLGGTSPPRIRVSRQIKT